MPSSPPSGKSYEEGARAEDDTIEAACASHGDLELNFDLEKSIYATMFIREIAKNIYWPLIILFLTKNNCGTISSAEV